MQPKNVLNVVKLCHYGPKFIVFIFPQHTRWSFYMSVGLPPRSLFQSKKHFVPLHLRCC